MDDRQIEILERLIPGFVNSGNYASLLESDGDVLPVVLPRISEDQHFDVIFEWCEDPRFAKFIAEVASIPWLSGDPDMEAVTDSFTSHLERLSPFAQVDPETNWYAAMSSAHSRIFGAVGAYRDRELINKLREQRDEAYRSVYNFSSRWQKNGGPNFNALFALSRNAAYEMAGELIGKPNPWRPLVDIYRQGALVDGYKNHELSLLTEEGRVKVKV